MISNVTWRRYQSIISVLLFVFSGLDDRINDNKELAEEAISKLPGINDTITDALATSSKVVATLDQVNALNEEATATISTQGGVVTSLEEFQKVRREEWLLVIYSRELCFISDGGCSYLK